MFLIENMCSLSISYMKVIGEVSLPYVIVSLMTWLKLHANKVHCFCKESFFGFSLYKSKK